MDAILTNEIIKSIGNGDFTKMLSYLAIFIFIWVEVRGLKNEVAKLNSTISKSFEEGEKRFNEIEHRLHLLEMQKKA